MPRPESMASMTYRWPSKDPEYWQALVEYVIEADHESNVPETYEEFIEDFVVWLAGAGVRVKKDDDCKAALTALLYHTVTTMDGTEMVPAEDVRNVLEVMKKRDAGTAD